MMPIVHQEVFLEVGLPIGTGKLSYLIRFAKVLNDVINNRLKMSRLRLSLLEKLDHL